MTRSPMIALLLLTMACGTQETAPEEAPAAETEQLVKRAPKKIASSKLDDCKTKCRSNMRTDHNTCVQNGGTTTECRSKVGAEVSECMAKACSDLIKQIEPDKLCMTECRTNAKDAFKRCTEEDGDARDCKKQSGLVLRTCFTDQCDMPRLERPGGDNTCRDNCLAESKKSFAKCQANGGDVNACRTQIKPSVEECIKTCET